MSPWLILLPAMMASSPALAVCTPTPPYTNAVITCGAGIENLTISTGSVDSLDMAGGNDILLVNGDSIVNTIQLGTGADSFTLDGTATVAAVDMGTGGGSTVDTAIINSGTITGTLLQNDGADIYQQSGGNVATVDQGSGADSATINTGSTIGSLLQGSEADTATINGGTINLIDQGSSNDILTINGSSAISAVQQGTGSDNFTLNNTAVVGTVDQGTGGAAADTATISGGTITGSLLQNDGVDTYIQTGGSVAAVDQGSGVDNATIETGSVLGSLQQGSEVDTATINGGTITSIDQGSSGDTLNLNGGLIDTINQGTGNDTANVTGGTVNGTFAQGDGTDIFTMSDGIIGVLDQGGDLDTANITGGRIIGAILSADTVNISGGRVGAINFVQANNVLNMSGTAIIDGSVISEQGLDTFTVSGGSIGTYVDTGSGADTLNLSGGATIGTYANMANGDDTFIMTNAAVGTDVLGGDGNDILTLTGGTVGGDVYGDDIAGLGTGNDTILLDGTIVSGSLIAGAGDDTITLQTGRAGGVDGGAGNDTIDWAQATATIGTAPGVNNGSINAGDGDDTLDINDNAIMLFAMTQLAGGTGVDTLNLNGGWSGALRGVTGWDTINVDGGDISFNDGAVSTSSAAGQGIVVTNNGSIDATNSLQVTGSILLGDGIYHGGTAGGTSHMLVSGTLSNGTNSIIDLSGGTAHAGDRLTVGSYVGNGGLIIFDTVLGRDSSPTDKLIVTGDTSGTTFIQVNNVGGMGAPSRKGIKLIDVTGASNGTFTLLSSYIAPDGRPSIIAGAYTYALYQNSPSHPADGDWYLRNAGLQPAAPVYEAYGQGLLELNVLSSLQERISNRYIAGSDIDQGNLWIRTTGTRSSITPSNSSSGARHDTDAFQIDIGAGTQVAEKTSGHISGEFAVHMGQSATKIYAALGGGKVDTKSYGASAAVTWHGKDGVYLDAQLQATMYDSDLSSIPTGSLASGNKGMGYAASLEMGKRLPLASAKWSVTPQAQLMYSTVSFDSFRGPFATGVSSDGIHALTSRFGVSLDYGSPGKDVGKDGIKDTGDLRLHAITNVYYNIENMSDVNMDGVGLISENAPVWVGIGFGGSYREPDSPFSLYADLSANSAIDDFDNSYTLRATAGMIWYFDSSKLLH